MTSAGHNFDLSSQVQFCLLLNCFRDGVCLLTLYYIKNKNKKRVSDAVVLCKQHIISVTNLLCVDDTTERGRGTREHQRGP